MKNSHRLWTIRSNSKPCWTLRSTRTRQLPPGYVISSAGRPSAEGSLRFEDANLTRARRFGLRAGNPVSQAPRIRRPHTAFLAGPHVNETLPSFHETKLNRGQNGLLAPPRAGAGYAPARVSSIHSSTIHSSVVNGTAPWRRIASWNALMSNASPSSSIARCRRSRRMTYPIPIVTWPG